MKLTLSNFQIHQKPTSIDIPENETTYLEGDSDTGKSSKLRAIRWLCENKPDGGSFVTFKQPRGTTSVVTLEVDGRSVTRERGKSKNLYAMDGETFEAFGRSVPEPVAKFLALSPYAFQCQGEVPFLIGASPTDAAKILSEACGLGVIDTAVQFVRQKKTVVEADIRKSEILLEAAQSRLSQATEQLPLADALEKAARVGDEAQCLSNRAQALDVAIDEEPKGEPLDIAAVARSAARARSAGELGQLLTGQAAALTRALHAEPVGALLDVTAVRVATNRAVCAIDDTDVFEMQIAALKRTILAEPIGEVRDVSGVYPHAGNAKVLGEWIADVSKSAGRIRLALQNEPQGEIQGTAHIRPVVARALAAFEEATMLDKMVRTMRAALLNEPQGVLMATDELKQQRAQIKVCVTCGREL